MTRNPTVMRPRLAAAVLFASLLVTTGVVPTPTHTAPPAITAEGDLDAPDPGEFEIDGQPGGFEVDGTQT